MKTNDQERLFAAVIAGLFLFDLNDDSFKASASRTVQRCWPHWPDCFSFPLLESFPNSYANGILFAGVFAVVAFTLWSLLKDQRGRWLAGLTLLTLFQFFYFFWWQFTGKQNFAFFHLVPTVAFLLNSRNRIFGAQLAWVVLLFFTALVKISDAWIVGSYFSSLSLGMPLVPKTLWPVVTQAVIIFEILTPWALFSSRYRTFSVAAWAAFHVYSVILVGFFYPVRGIAILLALFGPQQNAGLPAGPKISMALVVFLCAFAAAQLAPRMFAENPYRTLRFEGYMFNMFEANYQCAVASGAESWSTGNAGLRCSPFQLLRRAQRQCGTGSPVPLRIDQSLNGKPFYRIVDLADACSVQSSLWGKNDWIKTENEALLLGYPGYNAVNGMTSAPIYPEAQITLTPLQSFLRRHLWSFQIGYFILWLGMGLAVVLRVVRSRLGSLTRQK